MLKDESTRLGLEQTGLHEKIKENKEKIKLGNQLPYLVGNIVEILDVSPEDEEVRPHLHAIRTWQNEATTMAALHRTQLATPHLYCPLVSFRVY